MEGHKTKETEVPPVPLSQNEKWRAYREKTDKQDGYYALYQEFWNERRMAERKWAQNDPYDPYWLEINPDDLTNEDFFYYMMIKSEKIQGEEAKEMLHNEYWPRVEKYLNAEAAAAEKRAKSNDEPFNRQTCDEQNSRYNFYHWLLKMAGQKAVSAAAGQQRK
ncbi:hypothetical protein KGQ34_01135 [Patescibacteria group bacterium]|nr:hypothetical protein [Patescibacteria group bacterium]